MPNTNQIKKLLQLIIDGTVITECAFPELKNENVYSLIEYCEQHNFISTPMRKIIIRYSNEAIIADPLVVTTKGMRFLEEKQEQLSESR